MTLHQNIVLRGIQDPQDYETLEINILTEANAWNQEWDRNERPEIERL